MPFITARKLAITVSGAAIAASLGIAATADAVPASPVSAAGISSSPAAAAVPAYNAVGVIRPVDNPHWCLTWAIDPQDGSSSFWLPCIKNFSEQKWFLFKAQNVGQVAPYIAGNLVLGQLGRSNRAALYDFVEHATRLNSIVHYLNYQKGTAAYILSKKNPEFLTAAAHLRTTAKKPYYATWQQAKHPDKATQEFLLPVWHEVKS